MAAAKDPAADWFGPSGRPAQGDKFLDISATEVFRLGTEVVFRLTMQGAIPSESPSPDASVRWDIAIDTDPGADNGYKSSLLYNATRPDYVARAELSGTAWSGRLLTVRDNSWQNIDCAYQDNTVELRMTLSQLGNQLGFDCVGLAARYRRDGNSTNLVTAD